MNATLASEGEIIKTNWSLDSSHQSLTSGGLRKSILLKFV